MFYDRKMVYLDFLKYGERVQGAGFVKLEVRDNACNIDSRILGLPMSETFTSQLYLVGHEREESVCTLDLVGGVCTKQLYLLSNNLVNGLNYEEVESLRIPMKAGCELIGRVKILSKQDSNTHIVKEVEESRHNKIVYDEEQCNKKAYDEEECNKRMYDEEPCEEGMNNQEQQDAIVNQQISEINELPIKDATIRKMQVNENDEKMIVTYSAETVSENDVSALKSGRMRMQENKWTQLSAIYPHVFPFYDEREYLKLAPEDFVILNNRFYKLVHNSFLLHGYYNYQHLILTKMERRGESHYYIGVPGNFYEREKQVALMYGFESFECRREPADTGDYGYYMIRVEL